MCWALARADWMKNVLIILLSQTLLVSAATISGTVRNDAGIPLSGVFIDLYDDLGFFDFTVTGPAGTYLFQNLPGATYYLHTDSLRTHVDEWWDDVSGAADSLFFDPIKAKATPLTVTFLQTASDITFHLEPGASISGLVMSAGLPLTNTFVDAYQPNGTRLISALSDSNGFYTISGLPSGSYAVRTDSLGMLVDRWHDNTLAFDEVSPMVAGVSLLSLATGSSTNGINASLDLGAEIRGTVVDSGHAPVAGVFVDLVKASGQRLEFTTTDVNGEYLFGGIPNGFYFLSTESSGSYVDLWYDQVLYVNPRNPVGDGAQAIQVLGTNTVSGVDFSLTLGGMITGQVAGPGVSLVSNAFVDIYYGTNLFDFALTDSNGVYEVASLPAGDYYAKVDTLGQFLDEWYDDVVLVDPLDPMGDGATLFTLSGFQTVSNIHFQLVEGASISGQLVDAFSQALPGVFLDVYSAEGERLFFTQTNANGEYQIGGMPAGTYYLRTDSQAAYVDEWHDDQIVFSPTDPLADGATPYVLALGQSATNIDFALQVGGMLAGRVVFTNGAAIVDTFVDAYRGSNLVASVQTDASGNYAIPTLPDGTYYLRTDTSAVLINEWYSDVYIFHQGNPVADGATPIVLGVDESITNLVFELGLGADIEGTLTKLETGAGLENQTIDLFDATGSFYDSVLTGANGFYALQLLPPGDWYLGSDSLSYLKDEWYNDVLRIETLDPLADGSTVISLEDGTVRIEVDLALAPFPQEVLSFSAISNVVALSWSSLAQLPYQVERSTNLVSGVWTNAPSGSLPSQQSLQLGTGSGLLYNDPVPADPKSFYRVIPQ
jgi:hypothetical protein